MRFLAWGSLAAMVFLGLAAKAHAGPFGGFVLGPVYCAPSFVVAPVCPAPIRIPVVIRSSCLPIVVSGPCLYDAPAPLVYGYPPAPLGVLGLRTPAPRAALPSTSLAAQPAQSALAARPPAANAPTAPLGAASQFAAMLSSNDRSAPPRSNAAAIERAESFVGHGDRQFAQQKFREAVERYRLAARAAPDMAEAHFRLAFAYVATNRPQLAAQWLRKGLAIDAKWPQSSFRLDELYKDNRLAKQSHLDSLAHAALSNPDDADSFFTLAVFLHFDGQADRAEKFFRRAVELSDDTSPAALFLPAAPKAPPAALAGAAGVDL